VQQPELLRRAAVERFGAEDQPPGEHRTAEAGKALGAAGPGNESELDFRQADARLRGADAQVAGEGELEASAECVAANLGDTDRIELLDASEYLLQPTHEFELLLETVGAGEADAHLGEVRAGTEGAADASEVQHRNRAIVLELLGDVVECLDERATQ